MAQCRETLNGGKTQLETAEILGISREYLAALETNRKQPSYDLLVKIADHYGTSIDYFFSRRDKILPEGAQEKFGVVDNL